jgi:exodeoxyribonuclease III
VLACEPATPDYRTVLASRPGSHPRPELDPRARSSHLAAAVTAGGHTVGLLELYVPSRSPQQHRNKNKRAFQNAVATALPGFLSQFGDLVIVVGDLNVVEPGHLPRLPVFGAWEYAFCRSFLVAGLTDAYRARDPEGLDHSRLGSSGAAIASTTSSSSASTRSRSGAAATSRCPGGRASPTTLP